MLVIPEFCKYLLMIFIIGIFMDFGNLTNKII